MPKKDDLLERINNIASKKDAKKILSEYSDHAPPKVLCLIFEKLFIDQEIGFSRVVTIEELAELHPSYKTSNGVAWCRSDTSYLGKKYVVKIEKKGIKADSIKIDGFKKAIHSANIRKDIVEIISGRCCAILGVNSQIECDHKDGMKNDLSVADTKSQHPEDFQALSKAANDAKRTHCGRCKRTGKRFDARMLGYKSSYTHGDENSKVCQGCYWYDPKKFNAEISAQFEKKD